MLSTVYMSREKNDPVARELIAIGYFASQLPRKIGGVELSGQEYDTYQKVAGVLMRQSLSKVIERDDWTGYSADAKAKIARDVVNAAREKARNYIVMSETGLRKRIEAAAIERRERLLGPAKE